MKNTILNFPFEYKGGGYFREKGVPKGEPAKVLHGDHAIEAAIKHATENTFTIEEIADYITGWVSGSYGEVEKIGESVLKNALHQLRDDQDGIRKKA